MKRVDLSQYGVIAQREIEAALRDGAGEILVRPRAVLTPSAREAVERSGLVLHAHGSAGASGAAGKAAPCSAGCAAPASPAGTPAGAGGKVSQASRDLFFSPEAEAIKKEIVDVGRKLWTRQYVDGNGGNISCRIGPNEVICTPTLCSKADLKAEDLSLVDLEGNELIAQRPRTSEVFLHLEVFKAVPQAKAVVHCHPPHATAYALIGRVPPSSIVPEFDVFVGRVACTRYETPGTKKFAETVLPYVRNYNTVLLGNHGIVCWADTPTHAEWYAEVLETYCWTLNIASQLGAPITRIPESKAADLLRVKKRLGLPDPRFAEGACALPERLDAEVDSIAVEPPPPCAYGEAPGGTEDIEAIVRDVTDAVLAAVEARSMKR